MIVMMLKEETLIRVSLVFYLHLMTKHSTAAPRDLSFLIKTNSLMMSVREADPSPKYSFLSDRSNDVKDFSVVLELAIRLVTRL